MTLADRIRAIASAYEAAFGRGAVWRDVTGAMALAALALWGLAAIGALAIVMGGGRG